MSVRLARPWRDMYCDRVETLTFDVLRGGGGGGAGSRTLESRSEPPHSLTTSATALEGAEGSAEPSAVVKATSTVLTTDPATTWRYG